MGFVDGVVVADGAASAGSDDDGIAMTITHYGAADADPSAAAAESDAGGSGCIGASVVSNAIADLNWDTYEEEDTQVIERHLESWQNIGFIPDLQWYGATADFLLTFTNFRS